jgi:hypothetical protein
MVIDFNTEIQMLVLKPEYSLDKTEIRVIMPTYGGLVFEETRIFDPVNVVEEEYENYYYRGFHLIFDVVDKI